MQVTRFTRAGWILVTGVTKFLLVPLCCFFMATVGVAVADDPAKLFDLIDAAATELTESQTKILRKLKDEKTAANVQLVRLKPQALHADSCIINVSPQKSATATKRSLRQSPREGYTWSGSVKNDQADQSPAVAQFFFRGETGSGTFTVEKETYNLRPIGGGLHALIKRDATKVQKDEPEHFKEIEQEGAKKKPPEAALNAAVAESTPTTVSVMVLYTPAVASNHPDINTFIESLISISNTTYTESNVRIKLELAHAAQVAYTESGSVATDVAAVRSTNDGKIDNIHQLRDQHQADLVMMLIDHADAYGYASAILADASTAFAVADDEVADWYYTFAHELGHLFGARHDPENDPSTAPFAYGHCYRNDMKGWRTIMAYDCPGHCERIGLWSNPNIKHPRGNGEPAGTAVESDNARVLNQTAATIAAFR